LIGGVKEVGHRLVRPSTTSIISLSSFRLFPSPSLEGVKLTRRSPPTLVSSLVCACADGHLPVVLYLITKQNADPLVRNNFGETAYDVSAGVFEVYICEVRFVPVSASTRREIPSHAFSPFFRLQVLEQFEASRWPSGDAPRAEPYNVLAVHTSVPVVVYENQRYVLLPLLSFSLSSSFLSDHSAHPPSFLPPPIQPRRPSQNPRHFLRKTTLLPLRSRQTRSSFPLGAQSPQRFSRSRWEWGGRGGGREMGWGDSL